MTGVFFRKRDAMVDFNGIEAYLNVLYYLSGYLLTASSVKFLHVFTEAVEEVVDGYFQFGEALFLQKLKLYGF
jgi:hypothetical protein